MPSKKSSTKKKVRPGFEIKDVSIPGKARFKALVKKSKGIEGCYLQWGPMAKPTKQHPPRRFNPAMLKSCTEACR